MSGDTVADARYKASQAMAAYAPLAIKVFGSKVMWVSLKLALATSLVFSRLYYNAHVAVPTYRYLQVLNGPYMRVLRLTAGEVRFGCVERSDL